MIPTKGGGHECQGGPLITIRDRWAEEHTLCLRAPSFPVAHCHLVVNTGNAARIKRAFFFFFQFALFL